jgi:hypothetical protein
VMSESNDSRIQARECVRKAQSCNNSQERRAWLVLAQSWLQVANTQEIAEKSIEANKTEPAFAQVVANTTQHRGPAISYVYYEAGV